MKISFLLVQQIIRPLAASAAAAAAALGSPLSQSIYTLECESSNTQEFLLSFYNGQSLNIPTASI